MKKIICIMVTMALLLSLSGCGSAKPGRESVSGSNVSSSSTVQDILDRQTEGVFEGSAGNTAPAPAAEPESEPSILAEDTEYDVDLTKLSSTMVYSEVYSIMSEPEEYIGKKIRMNGQFAVYMAMGENGELNENELYFACIIMDATACCAQGLEFVLAGEPVYPDDYPEPGTDIVVSGYFNIYEEDGYYFCRLDDAVFE